MWCNPRSTAAAAAAIMEETPEGARLGMIRAHEERRAHARPGVEAAYVPVSARTRRLVRATLASTPAASKTQELTVKKPGPFAFPNVQTD